MEHLYSSRRSTQRSSSRWLCIVQVYGKPSFQAAAFRTTPPNKPSATSLCSVYFVYFVVPISEESAVSFFCRKGAEIAKGRKALVNEAMMMILIS